MWDSFKPINHQDAERKNDDPHARPPPPVVVTPRAGVRPSPPSPPACAAEVDFPICDPPLSPVEPPGAAALADDEPLTVDDVLCGRGPATNSLEGNRRFRSVVRDFQPTYLVARRAAKLRLARSVVLIVRARGGRFLRRSEQDGLLYELGDARAKAKAGQALREGLDVRATLRAAGAAPPPRAPPKNVAPLTKRRPVSPILHPSNLFAETGSDKPDTLVSAPLLELDTKSEQTGCLAGAFTKVARAPMSEAQYAPAASAPTGRTRALPPSAQRKSPGKLCNHDSCTKYKQTGCMGFCLTHAKLHLPNITDIKRRRKKKAKVVHLGPLGVFSQGATAAAEEEEKEAVEAAAAPPAMEEPTAEGAAAIDPTLAALVAAASQDPTLWKSPSFAAAMAAVVERTSGGSPDA